MQMRTVSGLSVWAWRLAPRGGLALVTAWRERDAASPSMGMAVPRAPSRTFM